MLKIIRPSLVSIRRYTTKTGLPFKESELKGDKEFQEFNNYYSDLFTQADQQTHQPTLSKPESLQDDIDEINSELNELYGTDTPMDIQIPQQQQQQQENKPKKSSTSSLLDKIKSNTPKIFISNSSNPFKNLALEDYIFKHTPVEKPFSAQRLIFYTNSPCVVIGKNQNPWRETNFPLLQDLQIPLLRRRSGGGTVVHDLGNVNYSYMTTRDAFSRTYFGSVIVKVVNEALGFEKIKQNERGDIVQSMGGEKLSGSAFKISRGKSYHHGTMLLNSNLEVLRQLLSKKGREGVVEFVCNAVDSVSSPVSNLGMPSKDFMALVQKGFKDVYGQAVEVVEVDEVDEEIEKISKELNDWKWRFGATPPFEMKLHNKEFQAHVSLKVEKGHLKEFTVEANDEIKKSFQYLSQVLKAGEPIKFIGSEVAGFILHDELSEWIGNKIDGTS